MNQGFDNPQSQLIPSPRDWISCGAHSVYHSLLCLGVVADKSKVVDLASLSPFGDGFGLSLDELKKLAKGHGVKSVDLSTSAGNAGLRQLRLNINRHLGLDHPVVLGVEQDGHWVVIAGRKGNTYYWIDSAGEQIAGQADWNEVVDWIGEPQDDPNYYAAMAVYPVNGPTKRSLVPWMDSLWETLATDDELANYWGYYLEQLDNVLDYGGSKPTIPAGEFFRINEEAIVQPVLWADTDGELDEDAVRDIYRSYWTVADMHSLMVPEVYQSHVACHLTLLLQEDAES